MRDDRPLSLHTGRGEGVRVFGRRLTLQNARQLLLTLLSRRRDLVGGRGAFFDDAGQRVNHDRIHRHRVLWWVESSMVIQNLDCLGRLRSRIRRDRPDDGLR